MAALRCAALLILAIAGVASAQTRGSITNLDDALRTAAELSLFQIGKDPLGDVDAFPSLPEREKKYWGTLPLAPVHTLLQELEKPIEYTASVEMILVGFENDGGHGINIHETDFLPYMRKMRSDIDARVARTQGDTQLPVQARFLFSVRKAPKSLAQQINGALKEAASKAPVPQSPSEAAPIDYSVVDSLVSKHYNTSRGDYTLYVLNPLRPGKKYVYKYEAPEACEGSLWIGSQRYAWVDLTAGPVMYGPELTGHGLVLESSFPAIERHLPSGLRPASEAAQDMKELAAGLVAEIAGLMSLWAKHMLSPVVAHDKCGVWESTDVVLLRLTDVPEDLRPFQTGGIDSEALQRELQLAVPQPLKVTVREKTVSFGECDLCAAAFASAERTHFVAGTDTRVHLNGSVSERVETISHRYLDSAELHSWLRDILPALQSKGLFSGGPGDGQRGGPPASPSPPRALPGGVSLPGGSERVLPVFLFDIAREELLLLDREHQAVAFPDMVLASRTHAGETPYRDFACSRGGSGSKPALLNSHELTRPILGALLEAGWGVVPTHRAWSEAQGRLVPDYVFSVGHTPFGPLAKGDSLSFAERDAAARSGVLATLNATVHGARKALEAFGRFPDADARLGREDRAALGARWHVLRHKLQRSARALGMQRWDVAVHYARSAGHDAAALERVLGAAGERLVTRLDCFQERPALATWVRVAGVLVGGRAALWAAKAAMPLLFGKRQHGKLF